MGCHTWFYKRSDMSLDDAISKAKSLMIQGINSSIIYTLSLSGHLDNLDVPYKKEQLDDWVTYNKRVLSWLEKGWITESSYKIICDGIYHNKIHYVDCGEFHDLFRLGGYPDDVLLSLDDTLKFIEENKNNIQLYDYSIEKLKLF